MGRRPTAPVVVDQRVADLAYIDGEIARFQKLLTDKQARLAADQKFHPLDQDVDLQKRLKSQISETREAMEKLKDQRFDIEIGKAEPKPQQAQQAQPQRRQWDIDEQVLKAGKPAYPGVVRGGADDDGKVFPKAWANMKAFWEASCMDHFRKADIPADLPVNMDFAASMNGEIMASHLWLSARCKALEERLEELESRPTVEYRGVWRSSEQYKRGDIVTHEGSAWHCEVASSGLLPGAGTGWRLAVKRGKDGRDAKERTS